MYLNRNLKRISYSLFIGMSLICLMVSSKAQTPPQENKPLNEILKDVKKLTEKKETSASPKELQQITAYLEKRYFQDSARSDVKWDVWAKIINALKGNFSPAFCARASKDIVQVLNDKALLAKMNYSQLEPRLRCLRNLGGKVKATQILASWVSSNKTWKTLDTHKIVQISQEFSGKDKSFSSIRKMLISHVTETVFKDQKTVQKVPATYFLSALVSSLHEDLSEQQKKLWLQTTQLRDARAESLWEDARWIFRAIQKLDTVSGKAYLARWVKHNDWNSIMAGDLRYIASCFDSQNPKDYVIIDSIFRHISKKYLANTQAIQKVGSSEWYRICRTFPKQLPEKTCEKWVVKLKEAYKDAPVSYREISYLVRTLKQLSDDQIVKYVSDWLCRHNHWKTWTIDNILRLPGQTDGKNKDAFQSRHLIAEVCEEKILNNPKVIQRITQRNWRFIVSLLMEKLPEKRRIRCSKMIYAALVNQKMPKSEVTLINGALKKLGHPEQEKFLISWFKNTKDWRNWSLEDVSHLLITLKDDSEGSAQVRKLLVSCISKKYINDVTVLKKTPTAYLASMTPILSKQFSSDEKRTWLRSLLAIDPKAKSSWEDANYISRAIGELDPDAKKKFLGRWVLKNDLKTLSILNLRGLASYYTPNGAANSEDRSVLSRIFNHISENYLTTGDAIRQVDLGVWRSLPGYFAEQLKGKASDRWAEKLREAYKNSKLDAQNFMYLTQALTRLSDDQRVKYVSDWLCHHGHWKTWKIDTILRLPGQTDGENKDSFKSRQLIAEVCEEKILKDAKVVQGITPRNWRSIVPLLTEKLSEKRQIRCSEAIYSALADQEMPKSEVTLINGALKKLGYPEQEKFLISWFKNTKDWRDWPLQDVSDVLVSLDDSEGSAQVRKILASCISKKYINDVAALKKMPTASLAGVTPVLAQQFSSEEKKTWLRSLLAIDPKVKCPWEDANNISQAVGGLDSAAKKTYLARWVKQNDLGTLSIDNLNKLASYFNSNDSGDPTSNSIVSQIFRHITKKYLVNSKTIRELSLDTWRRLPGYFSKQLKGKVSEEWAAKLRRAYKNSDLDAPSFINLAQTLRMLSDSHLSRYATEWLRAHPVWKTWRFPELVLLSEYLDKTSSDSLSLKCEIIKICDSRFLTDMDAIRSVEIWRWPGVANSLSDKLAYERTIKWAKSLKKSFVSHEMPCVDAFRVCAALGELGDVDQDGFIISWLRNTKSWYQWDLKNFILLAPRINGNSEEETLIREAVLSHITNKFFKKTDISQSATQWELAQILTGFSDHLSVEQKKLWLKGLLGAEAPGAKRWENAEGVYKVMVAVYPQQAKKYLLDWIRKNGLSSFSLKDLQKIIAYREPAESADSFLSNQVLSHVLKKYLSSPETIRQTSPEDWQSLCKDFRKLLTPQMAKNWAVKLGEGFDGSDLACRKLAFLSQTLQMLSENQAETFLLKKVNSDKKWRADNVEDMLFLIKSTKSPDVKKVILSQIEASFMRSPENIRDVGTGWQQIIQKLKFQMSYRQRQEWIKLLRSAYSNSNANLREVLAIKDAISDLGDNNSIAFLFSWLAGTDAWQSASLGDLSFLLLRVNGGKRHSNLVLRETVAKLISEQYLTKEDVICASKAATWTGVVEQLENVLSQEEKQQWAHKLQQAYINQSAPVFELGRIAQCLKKLGQSDCTALALGWSQRNDWRKQGLKEISVLGEMISSQSPHGQRVRAEMLDFVLSKYAANTRTIRNAAPEDWLRCAKAFVSQASAEKTKTLGEKLQKAYSPQNVGMNEAIVICDALTPLLSADVSRKYLLDWMGRDVWRNGSIDSLVALGQLLQGEGANVSNNLNQVMTHIYSAYLAEPSRASQVDSPKWPLLASIFAESLSDSDRKLWIIALRDAAYSCALDGNDLGNFSKSLHILGDSGFDGFPAQWFLKNNSWRDITPQKLQRLVLTLKGTSSQTTSAAQKVFQFLLQDILTDSTKTHAMGLQTWQTLAAHLAPILTESAGKKWIEGLRRHYPSEKVKDSDDIYDLYRTLTALGDKEEASEYVSKWMGMHEHWKQWELSDISRLMAMLEGDNKQIQTNREHIRKLVENKHMASPDVVQKAGISAWRNFQKEALGELTPEQRIKLIIRLRSSLLQSKTKLAKLNYNDIHDLVQILRESGDPEANQLIVAWILAGELWKQCPMYQLAQSVTPALTGAGKESRQARGKMIAFLSEEYLQERNATASILPRYWNFFIEAVCQDLDQTQRQAWAEKLYSAFVANQELTKLSHPYIRNLVFALNKLNPSMSQKMASSWLMNQPDWSKIKNRTLMEIFNKSIAPNSNNKELLERFDRFLAQKKNISLDECYGLLRYFSKLGDKKRAAVWLNKIYVNSVGTAEARRIFDSYDVHRLSDRLFTEGMTAKGKSYKEFALAVAMAVQRGEFMRKGRYDHPQSVYDLWGVSAYHHFPGFVLGSDGNRKIVRKVLCDTEGNPSLPAAKILSWAYRVSGEQGEFEAWRKEIEKNIQASLANNDRSALWMMAKAYVDAISPETPKPQKGISWLKKALAKAESPDVRMLAVLELAEYYRDANAPQAALDVISSVQHQFGEENKKELTEFSERLKQSLVKAAGQDVFKSIQRNLTQKRSTLAFYKSQLSQAEAQGETRKITALKERIEELERELSK